MAFGILIFYVVGSLLPWPYASYVSSIPPFLLSLSMLLMPESPSRLITTGQIDEAYKSMQWLRGRNDVSQEFQIMKDNITKQQQQSNNQNMKLLSQPVMMPLFISLALMFFQQWCGINAIIFNIATIFSASKANLSGSY